jgi:hypothetical protein
MEHKACEHPYRVFRKFEIYLHLSHKTFVPWWVGKKSEKFVPIGDAVGVKGFLYWLAVHPNKLTFWSI